MNNRERRHDAEVLAILAEEGPMHQRALRMRSSLTVSEVQASVDRLLAKDNITYTWAGWGNRLKVKA